MRDSQRLCGKGLIQFEEINLLRPQTGALQSQRHSGRESDTGRPAENGYIASFHVWLLNATPNTLTYLDQTKVCNSRATLNADERWPR